MVTKLCAVCARYFEGRLDGDYTCADCYRMGYAKKPAVSALDGLEVSPRPAGGANPGTKQPGDKAA